MRHSEHNFAFPGRQRGVVLILTLIVLVAMTLAVIALVRSVDTGNVVAGNLAFRQGAVQTGDAGTEAAIAFLRTGNAGAAIANTTLSNTDHPMGNPGDGYYAEIQNLDMTGNGAPGLARVNWEGNNCNGAPPAAGCVQPSATIQVIPGYTAQYVIQRLCPGTGAMSQTNFCVTFQATGSQSPVRDAINYQNSGRLSAGATPYYLITSRVLGPRNTVSYVEATVHF
jgi:Tfp pilus assembly protein PilX